MILTEEPFSSPRAFSQPRLRPQTVALTVALLLAFAAGLLKI